MTRLKRIALAGAACLGALALAGFFLDRAFPPDLARYQALSRTVEAADGSLLRVFATEEGLIRLPVSSADVDPRYLRFLKAYEDKRFDHHPGVDPLAMARALGQAIGGGRAVSGASTLTMQVARLLEPRQRSFGAKLIEAVRALQLEWRYSKDEILDLYLTLAPYGGNLEGVRAASLVYFGKEPRGLSDAEAALLVALPQAPTRVRPDRDAESARTARAKVLKRLVEAGVLAPHAAEVAALAPVPLDRDALPFRAPHLAQRLVTAEAGRGQHHTYIVPAIQEPLEKLAREQLSVVDARANIAVLVIETASGKVVGHVGSADFFSHRRSGQVDLTLAPRSPGSALKPILFGLAFDEHRAHPETILSDVRRRFGNYAPTNFDGGFQGEVTARHALQRSLNVPAVAMLEAVGPRRLLARLAEAGIVPDYRVGDDGPGLSLALGGASMTLEDLVLLYAGIARGGEVRALHYDANAAAPAEGARLIGTDAAAEIADVLRGAPRPLPRGVAGRDRVAFKTGTSYAFRDAWAIGFDATYTVGVWVGRPDGTPMPGVTGLSAAAPLLFRIFDMLPGGGQRSLAVVESDFAPAPPNLRRLGGAQQLSDTLALRFPLDGTMVPLESADTSLPLQVDGGRRPYTWLIDGAPLVVGVAARRTVWQPPGPGFYTVSVIDATGAAVRASIEIKAMR